MSIDPGLCGVLEKFKSELHNWIICACACVCDCVLCIVCCMCVHVCCILFVLLPGLTKVEMAALGSGATSEDVDMAQAMHFLFVIINVCVCMCGGYEAKALEAAMVAPQAEDLDSAELKCAKCGQEDVIYDAQSSMVICRVCDKDCE